MTTSEKFYSDVIRTLKNQSPENQKIEYIRQLFLKSNRFSPDLADTIFNYWQETQKTKIQEEQAEWISVANKLLQGDFFNTTSHEERSIFSTQDLQELCTLVNYEAEELPLDILTELMSVFTHYHIL